MRTIISILVASLTLVGIPFASADQTAPDCEDSVTYTTYDREGPTGEPNGEASGPQPGIGYRTTEAFWAGWQNDLGSPGGIFVCEGEHWDGQDTVQDDQGAATGTTRADPDDLFIGLCSSQHMDNDPSQAHTCPGLRVSSTNREKAFVGANIPSVGRAQIYADDSTVAVYLKDNTLTGQEDFLATVVSAAGITQGHVGQTDCSQETYQSGAMARRRDLCGRDNTAITVEHALLA